MTDILEKLDHFANIKKGDPFPEWFQVNPDEGAEPVFAALFKEAADKIRQLQGAAGAVTEGPSLSEIKEEIADGDQGAEPEPSAS
jgi:hypothetical protein